jgi:hypothetical protein
MNLSNEEQRILDRVTLLSEGYTADFLKLNADIMAGLIIKLVDEIEDLNDKVVNATKEIENLHACLSLYEDEGEDWSYEDSK